jgi:hypothetical protein
MMPAGLVLAAFVAWGSVPAPARAPGGPVIETAPVTEAVDTAPPSLSLEPVAAPGAPAAIAVKQLFDEPALVTRPAPQPRPGRPARAPLYRDWRFWAISGGLFAATIAVTIAVTRPGPQPYRGNLLGGDVISFP